MSPTELQRTPGLMIIAMAGLTAGVALVVLVVVTLRQREARRALTPIAGAFASSQAAPAILQSNPSLPSPTIAACSVAGERRIVAPAAIVAAGIEARTFGADVALGFAPNDHEAMLVRLDPSSLAISESNTTHAAYPIRHVAPVPGRGGRLGLAVDVDRPGDPLQGRRTLPIDPPLQIGFSANDELAWAIPDQGIQGKLWSLDGHRGAAVEALRGARSESNLAQVAVAFRRAGAVWVGALERGNALTPKGPLSRFAGLGTAVGAPAVAFDEGVVIVAWADRSNPNEPWQLRWTRFKAGEPPAVPSTFAPPTGGKGQEVMSPGLAVLPGQRFLITWTEGPPNDHEVRALTLSTDGTVIGPPLTISTEGVNAGQGQAAVTASGNGVVAFLESFEGGFRVAVAPVVCPP